MKQPPRPDLIDAMLQHDALEWYNHRNVRNKRAQQDASYWLGHAAGIIDALRSLGMDDLLEEALQNASSEQLGMANAMDSWMARRIRRGAM